MTDRRSETSRANLGHHVPEALDPNGTVIVGVRLTHEAVDIIDKWAADMEMTRSDALRRLIAYRLKYG